MIAQIIVACVVILILLMAVFWGTPVPKITPEEALKKEQLLNQLRSLKTGDLLITNRGVTFCVVCPPKIRGKSELVAIKESNWMASWTTSLENLTTMVIRVVPTTDLYWPVAARKALVSS